MDINKLSKITDGLLDKDTPEELNERAQIAKRNYERYTNDDNLQKEIKGRLNIYRQDNPDKSVTPDVESQIAEECTKDYARWAETAKKHMDLHTSRLKDNNKVKDSADSNAPAVYVGTYNKYNSGSLKGEWVDLTDFADEEDFMNYCRQLHADDGDPEIMFQDYQNFPGAWYHESSIDFDKIMEWYNLDDYDKEAVEEYLNEVYSDEDIQTILDHLIGRMSIEEYAQELLDDGCITDLTPYFDYEAFARDCELDGSFDPEEYPEYDGDAEQWLYDLVDDIGEDDFFKDLKERGLLENYVDIDMLCRDLSYDLTETANYLFYK